MNLYPTLLTVHSYLRYVVLILLVIVIIKSLSGWLGKKSFLKGDEKLPLFLLIAAHIQLLLGFWLYLISGNVGGEGMMKDPIKRYWTVEHISMMIIAIVLITIGKSSLKRLTTAESKHKRLFILNTIALLIIMAAIFMMKGRPQWSF